MKTPKLPLSPGERLALRRAGLRLGDLAGLRAAEVVERTGIRPERVEHLQALARFQQLPTVGPASAADFVLLGFARPQDLVGANADGMFARLEGMTGVRQDPCVLDLFRCAIHHATHPGESQRPWWEWSAERLKQGKPAHSSDPSGRQRPSVNQ